MLILSLALMGAPAMTPAVLTNDPDRLVCKSRVDPRSRMRLPRVCKTTAEWRGDYRDADAAADAAASNQARIEPAADVRPAEPAAPQG